MKENLPKVLIIILNWNNAPDTIKCLRSLQKIDYQNYEVLIIDNGSTDHSVCLIKDNFPQIQLIENQENLGVIGGRNTGIKFALEQMYEDAKPQYVLFLDNDTTVDRSFLRKMVELSQSDYTIGVLTSKIYFLKEPRYIWSAGGKVKFHIGKIMQRGENEIDRGQYDNIADVDFASGCVFLVKLEVLKRVGIFDTVLGMFWCEDIDFCLRAKKEGYRVVYVPQSVVWHRVSRTTPEGTNHWQHRGRNEMILMWKHASPSDWVIFIFLFSFILARAIYKGVRRGDLRKFFSFLYGSLSSFFVDIKSHLSKQ